MCGKYVYKNKSLIAIVTVFDFIFGKLWKIATFFARSSEYYPDKVQRILIVKLDHAGDVLMSTPAIKAIRNAFPQARITLVVGPWSSDIVKTNRNIDEIIIYKAFWHDRAPAKQLNLRETYNLIKQLRKSKYNLSFDLRGDVYAIIISVLAGIPKKIGYGWEGGGFMLTDEVKTSTAKHQVEILLDSLLPINRRPNEILFPEIAIADKSIRNISELLRKSNRNPDYPLVGIHLGAGYPAKLWETDRYAELMNTIAEKYDAQILIVGGSEDKNLFETIKNNLTFTPMNFIGKTDFLETAALLRQCNLFIGNDSAPAHIASAVGTPAIVIFSAANDCNRWMPYGKNVFVITTEPDCMNCQKAVCDTMGCMKAIMTKDVLNKLEEVRGLWE